MTPEVLMSLDEKIEFPKKAVVWKRDCEIEGDGNIESSEDMEILNDQTQFLLCYKTHFGFVIITGQTKNPFRVRYRTKR